MYTLYSLCEAAYSSILCYEFPIMTKGNRARELLASKLKTLFFPQFTGNRVAAQRPLWGCQHPHNNTRPKILNVQADLIKWREAHSTGQTPCNSSWDVPESRNQSRKAIVQQNNIFSPGILADTVLPTTAGLVIYTSKFKKKKRKKIPICEKENTWTTLYY